MIARGTAEGIAARSRHANGEVSDGDIGQEHERSGTNFASVDVNYQYKCSIVIDPAAIVGTGMIEE